MASEVLEVVQTQLQSVSEAAVGARVAHCVGNAELVLIGEATHGTAEF